MPQAGKPPLLQPTICGVNSEMIFRWRFHNFRVHNFALAPRRNSAPLNRGAPAAPAGDLVLFAGFRPPLQAPLPPMNYRNTPLWLLFSLALTLAANLVAQVAPAVSSSGQSAPRKDEPVVLSLFQLGADT